MAGDARASWGTASSAPTVACAWPLYQAAGDNYKVEGKGKGNGNGNGKEPAGRRRYDLRRSDAYFGSVNPFRRLRRDIFRRARLAGRLRRLWAMLLILRAILPGWLAACRSARESRRRVADRLRRPWNRRRARRR